MGNAMIGAPGVFVVRDDRLVEFAEARVPTCAVAAFITDYQIRGVLRFRAAIPFFGTVHAANDWLIRCGDREGQQLLGDFLEQGIALVEGRIVEALLGVDEIERADELFLTSSTREVVPIVKVAGRQIGDGRPGPVTRLLLDAYRRELDVLLQED